MSVDDEVDVEIDADAYLQAQFENGNELVDAGGEEETDDGLVPLSLSKALKRHHDKQRSNNRSPETIKSHNSRLKKFLAWLQVVAEVDRTDEIRPRHFEQYREQRASNVKTITVKTHMDTISKFVQNLESIQAVPEGFSNYVRSPSLKGREGQRSDHLPVARGDRLLAHLRKYRWGSIEHVVYELWWAAAIRLGGVHGIDEEDIDFEEGGVELVHRPETGTRLKNGNEGERFVSLTDTTLEAIQDYINNPERPDVTGEGGRNPLLVTSEGRASKSHLRNICYWLTTPCLSQTECPYDPSGDQDVTCDPETCHASKNKNHASKCPGSKAPHAIRSGAITRQLKREIPPTVISERCNVDVETLRDHYDEMTDRERARIRREWFDDEYNISGREAERLMFGDDDDAE